MKFNRLITTAAILLAGAFCTAQAAPTMAKHMQKGVTCEQCHNSSAPVADAGQLRCTLCHKEHEQSVLYCRQCHKNAEDKRFDMAVP